MSKKLTTEEFVTKAIKVHGSKYEYKNCIYTKSHDKVLITCKEHGDFSQKANGHLNGYGCPTCGGTGKLTTEKFIEESCKVHKGYYDYSLTKYTVAHEVVKIICPVHGTFEQKAYVHKAGHKCPKCAEEKGIGWTYTKWVQRAETSPLFDSFKVYIIRCWNDNEEFYKIGKTFTKLSIRHAGERMPYDYEEVKVIEGDCRKDISRLEKFLQKSNKIFKYKPNIKFKGSRECFSNINHATLGLNSLYKSAYTQDED